MANFLEGDTIHAYNEDVSIKGFYLYSEKWALMENYQMIDKVGRYRHFTSDPINKNRERYTDRERKYFLSVCTCRVILIEKKIDTKKGLVRIR